MPVVGEGELPVVECVQVIRRPRCPACGVPVIRCYAVKGRNRYYRCQCGCNFKAVVV